MSLPDSWPERCDFFPGRPICFTTTDSHLSAHGGLLLFRQLDERLGLTRDFASDLRDHRLPQTITHTYLDLVRQRVYAILADHEDQNDADTLRNDPVFKLLLGRLPNGLQLASQPTLSRFENGIDIPSLFRLRERFVTQFLDSFDSPPRLLTFDLDAVDDPAHGHQQLTFWHNYYDQNQYLPLILTCANNDLVVGVRLRHGSAHAALGADDDLEFLIQRVRARWPDVVIYIRADAGFAGPILYQLCERLQVFYSIGMASNPVLLRRSQTIMDQALADYQRELLLAAEQNRPAQAVRLLEGFWYQAGSWDQERFVVVKAEVNDQGSQRRFVVSNRPGAAQSPEGTYDDYAGRGESENRHKEFKCDLYMGRLSLHRFVANFFRLYLHALALNLLVRFRRLIGLPAEASATNGAVEAAPLPAAADNAASGNAEADRARDNVPPRDTTADNPAAGNRPADNATTANADSTATAGATTDSAGNVATDGAATADSAGSVATGNSSGTEGSPLPQSAQTGAERRRRFRLRRQRDVLGEGQPQTWRRLVIGVAVRVSVRSAAVVVELSSSWPHAELLASALRRLCQALGTPT